MKPTRRRARPTVPAAAAARPRASSAAPAAWLLIALALPRLLRAIYPFVWVEDDLYLESALGVARGLRPYLDFSHPQLPLLEWLAGGFVWLFGPQLRAMEVVNGAAIYIASVLVFLVGRRVVGKKAGIAASLLFACSSLVFRYHLWAREIFVAALALGAAHAALDRDRSPVRQVTIVAVALTAACAIKLTALLSAAALLAWMAIGQRQPRRAAAAAAAIAIALLAFIGVCYRLYGSTFVFQSVWFHLLKGQDPVGAGPWYPLTVLDVLAPLALLGLFARAASSSPDRDRWLLAAMLAPLALFYTVVSPTAWGHNYLELLPYVAMLSGAGAVWILRSAGERRWLRTAIAVAAIAGCLAGPTPLWNENAINDSFYGFGFVPRHETASMAAALRDSTRPGDPVIAPSFIAFEADRLQFVRYPENVGVMRAAEQALRSGGFRAARAHYGAGGFFDLINETSSIWNDRVIAGIAIGGPVTAFIADSPLQLLPLVDATPDALAARGFHLAHRTAHFTLWARATEK